MNPHPTERCDIVIPVWNNLEMTRDCINSITKQTDYPHRFIIIDNASGSLTREYLDGLKKENDERVVIIRNEKNVGFVKAVNQGMKYSDAPFVCIMNNDTIVTEGWLEELIEILRKNSDIGIINPSSNTSCQFPGKLDIDTYARTLKSLSGEFVELYTCRAFAEVVKRALIERIGYLDEGFGLGYFDDTDYSKRAQKIGFRVVRAKASYVYHRERASFSKIKERDDIFLENERRFISKWGRQLRVAYVINNLDSQKEIDRVHSNINRIAKMGHQVWVFTRCRYITRGLIEHESIRFFILPPIFFNLITFYKIWKRKKKKALRVILTNTKYMFNLLHFFKKSLDAEIMPDSDFSYIEKRINEISFAGDN